VNVNSFEIENFVETAKELFEANGRRHTSHVFRHKNVMNGQNSNKVVSNWAAGTPKNTAGFGHWQGCDGQKKVGKH